MVWIIAFFGLTFVKERMGVEELRLQTPVSEPRGRAAVTEDESRSEPEKVPFMQRVLENPFLLLFLGVVMPTVFYILWGIMEIATIPVAN